MRSEDILAQIDDTLDDWSVSDDAMRSRPGGEPEGIKGFTTQFAIMDEAGEWQNVPGVRRIDFHIEPPEIDPEFQQRCQEIQDYLVRATAERVRRAQQVMEAFVRSFTESIAAVQPRVEEAGRAIADCAKAVEQATPPQPPGQRHDRPAWQSPYGPPRRRR
ncbi:hypothetical protein [Streptomyces sp. NPDC000351]|uniref:hypothetical protein n=1 Tax=Streptomyces sp. NPDC000351 TaxID=3154250 RepID=UPI00332D226A